MKLLSLAVILQIISFYVHAQANKDVATKQVNTIAIEDKAAISKMVRVEKNKVIAQAGYHFVKVNETTTALKTKDGYDKGQFFCLCKEGGGGCVVWTNGEVIECVATGENGCKNCVLPTISIKGRSIPLEDVFGKSVLQH